MVGSQGVAERPVLEVVLLFPVVPLMYQDQTQQEVTNNHMISVSHAQHTQGGLDHLPECRCRPALEVVL